MVCIVSGGNAPREMELFNEFHTHVTLLCGKIPPVPIDEWSPELGFSRHRNKSLPAQESNSGRPTWSLY
jgi:hypothetical protein